jgi:hypothetical protein
MKYYNCFVLMFISFCFSGCSYFMQRPGLGNNIDFYAASRPRFVIYNGYDKDNRDSWWFKGREKYRWEKREQRPITVRYKIGYDHGKVDGKEVISKRWSKKQIIPPPEYYLKRRKY